MSALPPPARHRARANHACLPCQDASGTDLWLQNNAWGFAGDAPAQDVGVAPDGQSCDWRWQWPSRGARDDVRVVAYPGVIFGHKPFQGLASSTPELPVPLSRVARLKVSHDIRLAADGVHNAAFDLWLTRGPDAGADHKGAGVLTEVMVWLDHRGMHPAGACVETLQTPHGPARLFDGRVWHWRCLTFVLDAPHLAGSTDLGFFLAYLEGTGRLPRADAGALPDGPWLASVELGTEIHYGQGQARLQDLRVELGLDAGGDDERLAASHLRELVRERRASRSRKFAGLLPRPSANPPAPLFRA